MAASPKLTPKGAATRARIVEEAADLILASGVGGTSLDDIRTSTGTSKSQLFHYFPGGKSDLVAAISEYQAGRVLDAQRPSLDHLDTWEAWDEWRAAVLDYYGSQPRWGCPIGALTAELATQAPEIGESTRRSMDEWRGYLQAGLERMVESGLLRPESDPEELALSIFGSLHGGLMLSHSMESIEPLRAALDGALLMLHTWEA